MTEDMMLMMLTAVVAVTAVAAASAAHLRRQRILEFALRERERTLLRLTERFGTADEFVEFARSSEAQTLFAAIDAPAVLAARLLTMAALAVILVVLGAGLWINALSVPAAADIDMLMTADDASWWGTLCLATGIGLGIAAALCVRIGRRWGLIGG